MKTGFLSSRATMLTLIAASAVIASGCASGTDDTTPVDPGVGGTGATGGSVVGGGGGAVGGGGGDVGGSGGAQGGSGGAVGGSGGAVGGSGGAVGGSGGAQGGSGGAVGGSGGAAPECGNGSLDGTEECDDAPPAENGDGCSDGCLVEEGWLCDSAEPTVCASVCGDGLIVGSEACDDRNVACGTCNATCAATVTGGDCPLDAACGADADCLSGDCGGSNTCIAVCGNGRMESTEACDDAPPAENGDGCSSTCTLEQGWNCAGTTPTVCTPTCGDGLVLGTEHCDDHNTAACGTCSANCTADGPGATCAVGVGCSVDGDCASGDCGVANTCVAVCGNGLHEAGETCDDYNALACGSCNATCTGVGTGTCAIGEGCAANADCTSNYCDTAVTHTCQPLCGNGIPDVGEDCDDGYQDACGTCNANCTGVGSGSTCGDGVLCPETEECDDYNSLACGSCGAGCTGAGTGATCLIGDGCEVDGDCASGDCDTVGTHECIAACGNDIAELGEVCDGTDVLGKTCQDLGYGAGTLACGAGCGLFDVSDCKSLFFSEYTEASVGTSKALEIYNASGHDLDLTGCTLTQYNCGTTSCTSVYNYSLTESVAAGDVIVYCNESSAAGLLAVCDVTSNSNVFNFNGDDTLALSCDGVVLDVIGQIGFDPGSQFGANLTSTADNTIRRQCAVIAGDPDGTDVFDPADEWDGFADQTYDGFGSHCTGLAAPVWCILQHPPAFTLETAAPDETVYAQFYVAGLTDTTTTAPDPNARVIAQWGFGFTTDPADFTWAKGVPNGGFVGPSNDDEYEYLAALPFMLGTYDYAYRVSSDGGQSWLYCDLDGATNNGEFSQSQEGEMTVAP